MIRKKNKNHTSKFTLIFKNDNIELKQGIHSILNLLILVIAALFYSLLFFYTIFSSTDFFTQVAYLLLFLVIPIYILGSSIITTYVNTIVFDKKCLTVKKYDSFYPEKYILQYEEISEFVCEYNSIPKYRKNRVHVLVILHTGSKKKLIKIKRPNGPSHENEINELIETLNAKIRTSASPSL